MPRKYKRKTDVEPRIINWTQEHLLLAIEELKQNKRGINEISREYGISGRTLRRYEKIQQRLLSLGNKPVFNLENENRLANEILKLGEAGFPTGKLVIRHFAYEFAEKLGLKHNFNNEKKIAGPQWLKSFLERHPEITRIQHLSGSVNSSARDASPELKAQPIKTGDEQLELQSAIQHKPLTIQCEGNAEDGPDELDSQSIGWIEDTQTNVNNDSGTSIATSSLQGPKDEIYHNEDVSIKNVIAEEHGDSLQEPQDERYNEVIDNLAHAYIQAATDIKYDEASDQLETRGSLLSHQNKISHNDFSATRREIEIQNSTIEYRNNKIKLQEIKINEQDIKISTQDRLLEEQDKTIESLNSQLEALILKNDKLKKRNEFLRGSLRRYREKLLRATSEDDTIS